MDNMFTLKPIGYMKSVFHFKNGTPRQSSLCENARGILTIEKSVFNNPEHSLDGLQGFSHAWILFVFHKNNNAHKKAKVKPPRLDGQRVGVFSTRSPYRPNNIGLSLAKVDKIQDASIHFSGIDILDGTPVIDIKPYIPEYDKPLTESEPSNNEVPMIHTANSSTDKSIIDSIISSSIPEASVTSVTPPDKSGDCLVDAKLKSSAPNVKSTENHFNSITEGFYTLSAALNKAGETLKLEDSEHKASEKQIEAGKLNSLASNLDCLNVSGPQCEDESKDNENEDNEDDILDFLVGDVICKAASDVLLTDKSNVKKYSDICSYGSTNSTQISDISLVETTSQQRELTVKDCDGGSKSAVIAPWLSSPPVAKVNVIFSTESLQQLQDFHSKAADPRYRTEMLSGPDDAQKAITSILHEEPRSVYRRQKCQNSVYFFALDVLHVTCWFDGDAVTVLRIRPAADVPQLQETNAKSK